MNIEKRLNELLVALETRELTSAERAELDDLKTRVTDLEGRVGDEETAEPAAPAPRAVRSWEHTRKPSTKPNNSLRSWFRIGTELETQDDVRNVASSGATSQVYEVRAGLVSNAPTGSYAVPTTTLANFHTLLKYYCDWLKFSRVFNTSSGETLKIPVDATARQTNGVEIAAFIDEAVTDADKSVVLENRELKAFTATSGIQRLSLELLSDAAINIEDLVAKALATRIGRLLSKAFTTGSGLGEPTGLLHASSNIPTVATTAAGAIGLDDLIGLFSQLDPAYQSDPSVRFMMSPTIWGALLKLKDNANRPYFFAPQNGSDVTGEASGYILGKPVVLNPHMDSTIGAGKAAVVVGAFSEFAIRQAGNLQLRRSSEVYWANREVAYNSILRVDSKVLDADAFRALVGKA